MDSPLFGSFANDMLYGVCEHAGEISVHKDGMSVYLTDNKGSGCSNQCCGHVAQFIMCALVGLFAGIAVIDSKAMVPMIVFAAISYVVYLIIGSCTNTCKMIKNTYGLKEVHMNIQKGIDSAPELYHEISCYHYESHNSESGTTTTTKYTGHYT